MATSTTAPRPSSTGSAAVSSTSTPTSTYSSVVLSSFPLVPLTTKFSAPGTACEGIYVSAGILLIDATSSCLPSGFDIAETKYFSPGIECPSGYYNACYDSQGVKSITTVTCCPERQDGSIKLSCNNPATLKGGFANKFCTWRPPASGLAVTLTKSENGGRISTETTTMTAGGINAWGVRMVYQASDLPSSASSGVIGTGSTTPDPASATDSPTSSPTPGPSSSGLSTGATVAIAVVIPIVVIAALIVAYFFWWKKRKAQNKEGYEAQPAPQQQPWIKMDHTGSNYGGTPSYAGGSGYGEGGPGYQNGAYDQSYYGKSPSHNSAWSPPAELPEAQSPAELPAQTTPLGAHPGHPAR